MYSHPKPPLFPTVSITHLDLEKTLPQHRVNRPVTDSDSGDRLVSMLMPKQGHHPIKTAIVTLQLRGLKLFFLVSAQDLKVLKSKSSHHSLPAMLHLESLEEAHLRNVFH